VTRGVFIEYLGLAGDPAYDAKTKLKQRVCKKHGIKLLLIYPKDLIARDKLVDTMIEALIDGAAEYDPTYARMTARGQLSLFDERERSSTSAVDETTNDDRPHALDYDVNGQLYLFPDAPISRQLLLFLPR